MFLSLILLSLIIHVYPLKKSECNKWYTLYGCENKMVLLKNMMRSDVSRYISTQILTHNPEKKLTCMIDFGLPNYLKENLIETLTNTTMNSNIDINNTLIYLSKYIDNYIEPVIPLYIDNNVYRQFNLNKGVSDSILDNGNKIFFKSKGKPFILQFSTVNDKSTISSNWDNSLYSKDYSCLFNVGKYSNIWTLYNYISIEPTRMILSDEYIFEDKKILNEKKIKLKCNTTEEIISNYNNNDISLLFKNGCYLLSYVYLKETHIENYKKKEIYNIIIDPNSGVNLLPPKLYFLLYDTNSGVSSFGEPKKIKKGTNSNFIKLSLNDNNTPLLFYSNGIFDFNLNRDNNDIVLGIDMFKYFSNIVYDKKNDEFTLWITDITTDNNYITTIIDLLCIIESILFMRWYLTSNNAFMTYVFFNIMRDDKSFYYNNSKSVSELIILVISLVILSLSTYLLITLPNIPIYLIIAFAFQFFLLFCCIGFTIYFLIQSRDKILLSIKNIYKSYKGEDNDNTNKTKRSVINRWNEGFNTLFSSNSVTENQKVRVSQSVLKLYSLTTPTVIKQDILTTTCRNLIHMSLILLTMLTGYVFYLDTKLIKVFVSLISCILIYLVSYYYYTLIHAFFKFRNIYNKKIWIPLIILLGLLLVLLFTYISIVFIYNLLDSMNANHSTFIILVASFFLIFLIMVIPAYIILNNIEKWKSNIEKDKNF
jgi:hypothetical protein